MISGMGLVQKITLLVALPLLVQVVLYTALFLKLSEADREREQVARQKAIVCQFTNVYRIGLMSGKFMTQKRTGVTAKQKLDKEYARLEKLIQDDPKMIEHVQSFKSTIASLANTSVTLQDGAGFSRKHAQVLAMKEMKEMARKLNSQLDAALASAESIHNVSVKTVEQQRSMIVVLLCAGVAFDVAVAVFAVFYVIRRWSGRLRQLMDNTDLVIAGRALPASVGGDDEIAKLDRSFFEMATTLEEEEQQKQELVTTISHDLLAPIAAARGTISALEADPSLNAQGLKRVQVASRNLDRLVQLIDDLLIVERMRTGKLEINVEDNSSLAILRRSADSLRGMAETKGISLSLPDNDCRVLADADRMVQVVVNILSNALKFSPSGTTVTLSAQERPTEVEFRIRDQGKGMNQETLAKVFEPFEQAKDDQKQGTGLGLAICKEIVEQHGGEIGAESTPGEGSTFWFTLPRTGAV